MRAPSASKSAWARASASAGDPRPSRRKTRQQQVRERAEHALGFRQRRRAAGKDAALILHGPFEGTAEQRAEARRRLGQPRAYDSGRDVPGSTWERQGARTPPRVPHGRGERRRADQRRERRALGEVGLELVPERMRVPLGPVGRRPRADEQQRIGSGTPKLRSGSSSGNSVVGTK